MESTAAIRQRLRDSLDLEDDAPVDDVIDGAYELLGRAPSMVLCATLEDVVAAELRPNLPGTTGDVRPNWSIALPETLEEIQGGERAVRLARRLSRVERSP